MGWVEQIQDIYVHHDETICTAKAAAQYPRDCGTNGSWTAATYPPGSQKPLKDVNGKPFPPNVNHLYVVQESFLQEPAYAVPVPTDELKATYAAISTSFREASKIYAHEGCRDAGISSTQLTVAFLNDKDSSTHLGDYFVSIVTDQAFRCQGSNALQTVEIIAWGQGDKNGFFKFEAHKDCVPEGGVTGGGCQR